MGFAGGDGSLGRVAEAALERDVPFVCVPLGTRNHFARDIGLDRANPLAAPDAFGAAIDGEPVELASPVELAVEPRALRILLP